MREALLLAIGRLVCTTPWFIMCCVPYYPDRRVGRRTMVATISIVSILFFGVNYYLRLHNELYASYASGAFMVLYVILVALFLWGFRISLVKALYVFLLVQVISTTINYTAAIVLRPIYKNQRISLQTTPAYTVTIGIMTIIVCVILWQFFTHTLREAAKELSNHDFGLLCISPVLVFIITVIFSDMTGDPSVPQEKAISIFLLIAVLGLVTYYLNIRMVLDTSRRIRLETDMKQIKQQISMQAQRYQDLTDSIEAAREARHDLRHHLTAMTAYVDQGDIDGLTLYLSEYRENLANETILKICNNYSVDSVVNYYLSRIADGKVELDIKMQLPSNVGIPDTDLVVVFGNLFENAVNGILRQPSGERFIKARCQTRDALLILTLDNSIDPTVPDTGVMGIGQESILAVAKKYRGDARFERKADCYQASVLLHIPQK